MPPTCYALLLRTAFAFLLFLFFSEKIRPGRKENRRDAFLKSAASGGKTEEQQQRKMSRKASKASYSALK
jgi:hypothetical protein